MHTLRAPKRRAGLERVEACRQQPVTSKGSKVRAHQSIRAAGLLNTNVHRLQGSSRRAARPPPSRWLRLLLLVAAGRFHCCCWHGH